MRSYCSSPTALRFQKFDGILGFSQGAIAASLICGLLQTNANCGKDFDSVRFAVLISGFPSRADEHFHLYRSLIELPSLHIWGTKDQRVPPWMSKALLEKFHPQTRQQLEHAGGHVVPGDAVSRKAIFDFLLQFRVVEDDEDHDDSETPRAAL